MTASTGSGSATRQLAEFAASIKFSDLPADDQVRTKLRLLNVAGSILAARRLAGARLVRSYSETLAGGGGSSSFWLSGSRGRPEDAAFVNGMWAHLALLDDTVTHTGTMLIPAALAVAEARECSGEDVLAALAVGYEITARIETGLMLASAVTLQGFRHSWPGVFGAAVATAKLMGLPVNGIMDSLALISTLAVPGTMAWYCNWADAEEAERLGDTGVTERYLQLGANAKNAVLAASLAEGGFHGTSMALEGECGVYAVYANGMGLPPDLSYRLGQEWHLAPIGVKPYPGSWVIPVYCAERIVKQRAIESAADVDHIRVDMVTWKRNKAVIFPGPFTNQEQALASTPFNVAATLIFGKYDVDVLARATGDPRVDELAAKVRIGAIPGAVTPEAKTAVVEAVFADGTSIREDASSMPSSVLRPDTWADMNARFEGMCGDETADSRRAVSEYIEHFEKATRVALPICSAVQSRSRMGMSITPIHCGVLSNVERSSQQYLVGCGERIEVPLIMWLILGGERPVIVDVGAGTPDVVEEYQGRHLAQSKSPLDSLAALGLEPADIGSVIITHAHWDHVLGLAALDFPAAKIYIQRSELDFAMHPLPTQRGLYHPRLVQRLTADAGNDEHPVVAVDGDRDIAAGVKMIHTPGHTPGTSAVLVQTSGRVFAIASDTVALQSSLRGKSSEDWCPPGIHVNLADCYSSMRRLAQESAIVLPSHDEAVFARETYQ